MDGKRLEQFMDQNNLNLDDLSLLLGMHKEHVRKLLKKKKGNKLLALACYTIAKQKLTKPPAPISGNGIRLFRAKHKISRQQLADYLGLTRQAIMYMERKQKKPVGRSILMRLALMAFEG